MKKYFSTIFLLGLIFSIYSVSALYQGTIGVAVGNSTASITIGDIPSVNVTNNSGTTTSGDTDEDTPAVSGGRGGSLLSSVIKSVFNDEKNKTESSNSNDEENPEEKTTSTNFLTGAVIGISDFAKTPAGVATFIIVGLFAVGGVTFLAIKGKFKNFLPKKKDNITEQ